MSDFDDELLELAEVGSEKKRRTKKAKKRKAEQVVSDAESEDEEDEPYPLEGKYANEADKQVLLKMTEIEREDILAQRAEERQKLQDRKMVRAMIVQREREGLTGGAGDDGVARGAKRQRSAVGATKEKTKKLDELKAKRQAKGERVKGKGSPAREGSTMDTGSSDEDDVAVPERPAQPKEVEEPATFADFIKCIVTRDMIAKHFLSPWFEEYITDSWVRYLIGNEDSHPVYRICLISSVNKDKVRPYKMGNMFVDKSVQLQHGKSVKTFTLDRVSNSKTDTREFSRLKVDLEGDGIDLPTRQSLETKKKRQLQLTTQPMTEADINAVLVRKKEIEVASGYRTQGSITMERSKLMQQRTLAVRRQDHEEIAELDQQIADFSLKYGEEQNTPSNKQPDMLAILSEKNRKANAESVRRAEIAAAREKKLNRQNNSTPDPSARLKTVPRVFNDAASTATSRAGTPARSQSTPAQVPVPRNTAGAKTFETSIVDSIEVDLGDF